MNTPYVMYGGIAVAIDAFFFFVLGGADAGQATRDKVTVTQLQGRWVRVSSDERIAIETLVVSKSEESLPPNANEGRSARARIVRACHALVALGGALLAIAGLFADSPRSSFAPTIRWWVLGAGVLVLFLDGLPLFFGVRARASLARLRKTPTIPIARAPRGAMAAIEGKVVAGEQGTVQAPLSDRSGVWVRVRATVAGDHGGTETLLDELRSEPFFIEDGSGERAQVFPAHAEVILVEGPGTQRFDRSPRLEELLKARQVRPPSTQGWPYRVRCTEQVLAVGDTVFAIGLARRTAGPPLGADYRAKPEAPWVLDVGDGEWPTVTTKTRDQLAAGYSKAFWGSLIAAAVGWLLVVVGLGAPFGWNR
jgi:hypothetical protein